MFTPSLYLVKDQIGFRERRIVTRRCRSDAKLSAEISKNARGITA